MVRDAEASGGNRHDPRILSRSHLKLALQPPDESGRTRMVGTAVCHTLLASAEFNYGHEHWQKKNEGSSRRTLRPGHL